MVEVSSELVSDYEKRFPDNLKKQVLVGTVRLQLNPSIPPLDDVNVRKAIAMAIDKTELVEGYFENNVVAINGIIPEGIPGFNNNIPLEGWKYDPEGASDSAATACQSQHHYGDLEDSALDVSIQSQILNLLVELRERFDLTLLFISHDLGVVEYISDRVAVMYLGRIVELAETAESFVNPQHPYTKALLFSIPQIGAKQMLADGEVLEGEIPSPIAPPPGCAFHTRCSMAIDRCRREVPVLEETTPGHLVSCLLK